MSAFMCQDGQQDGVNARLVLPCREVFGFEAGGGAAPAKQGERRGGQEQQKREAE